MSELVAVFGDEESHLGGALQASNNSGVAFINGKKIVMVGSLGSIDGELHTPSETTANSGSSKVYVAGISVHRHGDSRACGATTIVSGQTKVFAS